MPRLLAAAAGVDDDGCLLPRLPFFFYFCVCLCCCHSCSCAPVPTKWACPAAAQSARWLPPRKLSVCLLSKNLPVGSSRKTCRLAPSRKTCPLAPSAEWFLVCSAKLAVSPKRSKTLGIPSTTVNGQSPMGLTFWCSKIRSEHHAVLGKRMLSQRVCGMCHVCLAVCGVATLPLSPRNYVHVSALE